MLSTFFPSSAHHYLYGSFHDPQSNLSTDQDVELNYSSSVEKKSIKNMNALLAVQFGDPHENAAALLQADKTLDVALALTTEDQRKFDPEEILMSDQIRRYVQYGDPGEYGENTKLINDAPTHLSRLERLTKLFSYVTNNEAESPLGRHTLNVSNVALRHVVNVMIPTLLRQMISYTLERDLRSRPEDEQVMMRTTIAFLAASYPLILNVVGAIADHANGVSNRISNVGRALNVVVGLGTLCAAYATGALPNLAVSLVSFNGYCVLRDGGQLVLRQDDGTKKVSVQTVAISSAAYAVDQMAVGTAMTQGASPSGQSAAALRYGDVWRNDVLRGAINCGGEIIDTLLFSYGQNAQEQRETRIKLKFGLPTRNEVIATITGAHAGRTFLFNSTLLFGAALSTVTQFFPDPHDRDHADNAITAVFLGLFYGAFVVTAVRGKVDGCTLL